MTEPLSLPVFRKISRIVDGMGLRAYVIGGYVRDYYLCRPCTDIDVVVVGSGIDVAEALARETGSNVTVFKTFGTAMLRTEGIVLFEGFPQTGRGGGYPARRPTAA